LELGDRRIGRNVDVVRVCVVWYDREIDRGNGIGEGRMEK
jgi:hypothetical protein